MLTVGLTGGLACGKSFVASELQKRGCHIIRADQLGHEVLAPDGEASRAVIERFGPSILDAEGRIQRSRLAEIVFRDPEALKALNGIVHPAVRLREAQMIEAIRASDPHAIVVIEAAILIETGFYKEFDKLIVVVCDESAQLERALARDPQARREDVVARLGRQMPAAEKRKYADFVIDTSGTPDDTARQTIEVYSALRALVLSE